MKPITDRQADFAKQLNQLEPGRYWLESDGLSGRVHTLIDVVRLKVPEVWNGRHYPAGLFRVQANGLEQVDAILALKNVTLEPVSQNSVMAEVPEHRRSTGDAEPKAG